MGAFPNVGYTVGVIVAGYPRRLLGMAAATAVTLGVRHIIRVEVRGWSMAPSLRPGDRMVAVRGLEGRPGDIVAVHDPRVPTRMLVKRVAAVDADHRLFLAGDAPSASTDSRSFGPVLPSSVAGRVVWRYWPWEDRGPLP
ncbi:hypothetical protein BH24ACT1_BH24ACT1_06610 [soil metagenome]